MWIKMDYTTYINSSEWKEKSRKHLKESPKCECCINNPTEVHHLSYERLWNENRDDLKSVCKICHGKCHTFNKVKVKNTEKMLKQRFNEVRESYFGKNIMMNWIEYKAIKMNPEIKIQFIEN